MSTCTLTVKFSDFNLMMSSGVKKSLSSKNQAKDILWLRKHVINYIFVEFSKFIKRHNTVLRIKFNPLFCGPIYSLF